MNKQPTGGSLVEADVEALVHGCGVLGAGGGGDTTLAHAVTALAVRDAGAVALVGVDALADDALVVPLAFIGAPAVLAERILSGAEATLVREHVEDAVGREVAAVMNAQIGGGIGAFGAMWAARLGVALVDADGIGSAATEITMTSMHLHDVPSAPILMADSRGVVVRLAVGDNHQLARLTKGVAATLGGACVAAMYPMQARVARAVAVRGTVSKALAIGRALCAAGVDPIAAAMGACAGRKLLTGRIVEVEPRGLGATRTAVVIEGVADDAGLLLRLELQNEIHVAQVDGEVVACTPDIITMLASATGRVISRELIRRGLRVTVVGIPCDPVWRCARGLALRGPEAFGYDVSYVPVESTGTAR